MKKAFVVLLVLVVVAVVACVVVARHGISARAEPTRVETLLARTMRHWAVSADVRHRANPLPLAPAVLAEARAHFADHCATCHGNDGKGNNALGRQMYPRTPYMTLPSTQSLSDGELFAIIENGVRLTGMPAFGDGSAESARSSWALVHFIRHLPKITPAELQQMKAMNPMSPGELKEQQQEDEFLKGK